MIYRSLEMTQPGNTSQQYQFDTGVQVIKVPEEQQMNQLIELVLQFLFPSFHKHQLSGSLGVRLDSGVEHQLVTHDESKSTNNNDFTFTSDNNLIEPANIAVGTPLSMAGFSYDMFATLTLIRQQHLNELGDTFNLDDVSQQLAVLAGSGMAEISAAMACSWLDNRIVYIGRGGTPAKPLTRLRNRCNSLQKELDFSRTAWRDVRESLAELERMEEELVRLHQRRQQVEVDIKTWEAHERAKRLNEAEVLLRRIAESTQQCFALSAARDFPSDLTPGLRQQENRLLTAKLQLERSMAEMDELKEKVHQENLDLEKIQVQQRSEEDVPEALEEKLHLNFEKLQELGNQLESVQEQIEDTETRLLQAQDRSAVLPDFSRFAADPVEWVTQLTQSFKVAVRTRMDECTQRDLLQAEYDKHKSANAEATLIFSDWSNFSSDIRRYEELQQENREGKLLQNRQWQMLRLEFDEISERMPGFLWMATGCGLFLVLTLAAFAHYQNPGILVSSLLMMISMLYFTGNHVYARKRLKQLDTELIMLNSTGYTSDSVAGLGRNQRTERSKVQEYTDISEQIEKAMQQAGCQSLRELEAMYDTYKEASAELKAREALLKVVHERASEAEERVPKLFRRIQDTFRPIGIHISSEDDVEEAAGNAIARYQEYREAKRRVTEYRSMLERLQQEYNRLKEEHANARNQMAEAEKLLKEHFEKYEYIPIPAHSAPLEALRQFRAYVGTHREAEHRQELLCEQYLELKSRIDTESAQVDKEEKVLSAMLGKAGVTKLDEWHEKEKLHHQYQVVWEERVRLENELDLLLHGRDITEIRRRVKADSPLPEKPDRPGEALRAELDALSSTLELRDAAYREEQMRLSQRQLSLGNPTLIEETLAWHRKRLDMLEIELEAATRALTLLEDAMKETYQHLVPDILRRVQPHIELLSGGKYYSMDINAQLQMQLISGNGGMPHGGGTEIAPAILIQLYMALRLALLQALTHEKESLPLLIVEPFAGFDHWQLERTLRLVQRMTSDSQQVLVFTGRDDVVHAAEAVNVSVIRR